MKVGSFTPEQSDRVLYARAGDDCSLHRDLDRLTTKQQGLMASQTQQVITAGCQECRIRHFHQTLDSYLNEALSR